MAESSVEPIRVKAKGTRQEVWDGLARHTSGGLTKDDLWMDGKKLKSKRKSNLSKGATANTDGLKRWSLASRIVLKERGETFRVIRKTDPLYILAKSLHGSMTLEELESRFNS